MEKQNIINRHFLLMAIATLSLYSQNAISQPVIGLDNWYNRETNVRDGKPFHYLWTDTASSFENRKAAENLIYLL